jgi:hypothetical protein
LAPSKKGEGAVPQECVGFQWHTWQSQKESHEMPQ